MADETPIFLEQWTHHVEVVCPSCSARTAVRHLEEEARWACGACGKNGSIGMSRGVVQTGGEARAGVPRLGVPVDPYFGFELWFSASFRGETLWAYNEEHLKFLEREIGQSLRGRAQNEHGYSNRSVQSRLPKWMLISGHRKPLLALIQKMLASHHRWVFLLLLTTFLAFPKAGFAQSEAQRLLVRADSLLYVASAGTADQQALASAELVQVEELLVYYSDQAINGGDKRLAFTLVSATLRASEAVEASGRESALKSMELEALFFDLVLVLGVRDQRWDEVDRWLVSMQERVGVSDATYTMLGKACGPISETRARAYVLDGLKAFPESESLLETWSQLSGRSYAPVAFKTCQIFGYEVEVPEEVRFFGEDTRWYFETSKMSVSLTALGPLSDDDFNVRRFDAESAVRLGYWAERPGTGSLSRQARMSYVFRPMDAKAPVTLYTYEINDKVYERALFLLENDGEGYLIGVRRQEGWKSDSPSLKLFYALFEER